MRLTIRTHLALRTLTACAINPERTLRKHEIAEAACASGNHLAQVVNTLARLGYLHTLRGRAGGMRLAQRPEEIRLGALVRAFEGDAAGGLCANDAGELCPMACCCRLRGALETAIAAFYAALDEFSLADMIRDNDGLTHLLDFGGPIIATATPCTHAGSRAALN